MKQWKCEHCQGPIGPVPNLAGQTVACPYCLAPITVPSNESAARRQRSKWKWLLALTTLLAITATVGLILKPIPLPDQVLGFAMPEFMLTGNDDPIDKIDVVPPPQQTDSDVRPLEMVIVEPSSAAGDSQLALPLSADKVEEVVQTAVKEVVQTAVEESVQQAVQSAVQTSVESAVQNSVHAAVHDVVEKAVQDSVQAVIQKSAYESKPVVAPSELAPAAVPRVDTESPAGDSSQMTDDRPGLGVSRDYLIHAIRNYFDVEFFEGSQSTADQKEITASIAGAEVTLVGTDTEVKSITVACGFSDSDQNLLMATIIGRVMPSWHIHDMGDWLSKATKNCDGDTLVSTLRDNVELTMTDAGNGNFWVFLQADRE